MFLFFENFQSNIGFRTSRVKHKNKKIVYILIGPKGSGKTYIGTLIERSLGIGFLRVEKILLDYIKANKLSSTKLERDGFDIEENAVRERLKTEPKIIFEATGSSEFFPGVIENLSQDYIVKLIRIHCPLEICLERVKQRPLQDQFEVGVERVKQINNKANQMVFNWDLEINNTQNTSDPEIISTFASLL